MSTIILLLIIFLPMIFKGVEKKLQNAGMPQADEVFPKLEPLRLPEDLTDEEREEIEELKRETVKKRKPILVEEVKTQKEKIDPKKLILYSEIMKPKYD